MKEKPNYSLLKSGDEVEVVEKDGYKYLKLKEDCYVPILDENGDHAKAESIH